MILPTGIPYVVTRGSDDGTFKDGDHICLQRNGDLSCREAGGWLNAADVPDVIQGMQCKADTEAIAKRIAKAETEIAMLSRHRDELKQF